MPREYPSSSASLHSRPPTTSALIKILKSQPTTKSAFQSFQSNYNFENFNQYIHHPLPHSIRVPQRRLPWSKFSKVSPPLNLLLKTTTQLIFVNSCQSIHHHLSHSIRLLKKIVRAEIVPNKVTNALTQILVHQPTEIRKSQPATEFAVENHYMADIWEFLNSASIIICLTRFATPYNVYLDKTSPKSAHKNAQKSARH